MLKDILLSALLSGILLGTGLTVMHAFTVYPVIQKAERYVAGPAGHPGRSGDTGETATSPPAQIRIAANDSNRLLLSFVSNAVLSVAFALFLNIGFSLHPFEHWSKGIYWGVAGLTAFFVLPTFIHAPSLPGSIEAEYHIRQIWWVATVEAGIFGIALAVFPSAMWMKAQGGLLVVVAFLIGAPPDGMYMQTPESLVNQFYFVGLVTNSIYWLVLGVVSAYCFKRLVIDKGVVRAG